MSNEVVVIPSNIELPARLRGVDIASQIAAQNAVAAGGIKTGAAFPKISIKANKFHIVDGDETTTLTMPAEPGQPILPRMCLEIAVVAANPAVSKTYYASEFVEGSKAAPDCQSSNGLTPDASIAAPQHTNCTNCPKAAWGSAISKLSGEDIPACSDSKQLAILPAGDLNFKMLGLNITKGSIKNWGLYVKALTGRNMLLMETVTNVTFDATKNGVLQFGFNRYLNDEEAAKVKERAKGDDVKAIIQPSVFVPAAPTLPAPTPAVALAAPASAPAPASTPAPTPAATAPNFGAAPVTSPSIAAAAATFAAPATPPAAAPTDEPPKRTRAKRTPAPAAASDGSHLPAGIKAAFDALPEGSPTRAALLAQFPPPAAPAVADPFAGQPPHVAAAVNAVGGLATPAGQTVFKSLTGKDAPNVAAPAPATAPMATAPAVTATVAPVAAAPSPAPVAPAFTAPAAPAATAPTPAVVASGASLADILKAKLGITAPANTTVQ